MQERESITGAKIDLNTDKYDGRFEKYDIICEGTAVFDEEEIIAESSRIIESMKEGSSGTGGYNVVWNNCQKFAIELFMRSTGKEYVYTGSKPEGTESATGNQIFTGTGMRRIRANTFSVICLIILLTIVIVVLCFTTYVYWMAYNKGITNRTFTQTRLE